MKGRGHANRTNSRTLRALPGSSPWRDVRPGCRYAGALALLLFAGITLASEPDDSPIVVMISIDGFRHDYLAIHDAPNLSALAERGVTSDGLIPIFPTKTFPNHLAIVTGMRAGRHGIVGNGFHDRERQASYTMGDRAAVEDGSWYWGEPLWVSAERQGLRTAAFFWVGTEAAIGGVRPTDWRSYDKSIPGEERVATVLSWLARPEATRPRLVTLYFADVDTAGHTFGPDSTENAAAVARVDGWIGQLVAGVTELGLDDRVHYVIVADHGMRYGDPSKLHRLPPAPEATHFFNRGTFVAYYTAKPADGPRVCERAGAAGLPVLVLHGQALAARFGGDKPDRLPDCMVVAEPGELIAAAEDRKRYRDLAGHGYVPEDPEMHAIFIAAGPRIRSPGRIPAFENIHVHPLVAALLGLKIDHEIDGDPAVLTPLLSP